MTLIGGMQKPDSPLFKDIPDRDYMKALDRLRELRMQHPGATDWDLLLFALAIHYGASCVEVEVFTDPKPAEDHASSEHYSWPNTAKGGENGRD